MEKNQAGGLSLSPAFGSLGSPETQSLWEKGGSAWAGGRQALGRNVWCSPFSLQDQVLILFLELLSQRLLGLPTALWRQVGGSGFPPPGPFVSGRSFFNSIQSRVVCRRPFEGEICQLAALGGLPPSQDGRRIGYKL